MPILVLEDDDSLRAALERVLAASGFEVITAKNGPASSESGGEYPIHFELEGPPKVPKSAIGP